MITHVSDASVYLEHKVVDLEAGLLGVRVALDVLEKLKRRHAQCRLEFRVIL